MNEPHDETHIPEEFWSAYSEGPFDECIDCGMLLAEGPVPYAIQKHFVAGEAVFEMAICMECATQLQQEFSIESRQAIVDFVRDAPERERRQREAVDDELPELDDTAELVARLEAYDLQQRVRRERAMSSCAICAKLRSECHRYSLGTACLGTALLNAAPDLDNLGSPFLVCEECEMRLNECISQQTRDSWDRFVEETFDGPPALSVDPRDLVAIF